MQNKPRTSCRTRLVYLALVAVFLVSSSIAVSVAVSEIRAIQETFTTLENGYQAQKKSEKPLHSTAAITAQAQIAATSSATPIFYETYADDFNERAPCSNNCSIYGKENFRSRCQNGFCVCEGEDYQRDTCLPAVSGCVITKHPASRQVSMWNRPCTVFKCNTKQTPSKEPSLYVISIYGNHFSDATWVNVKGRSFGTARLVLASHFPVRWKLSIPSLAVKDIIVISENKLSVSQVLFNDIKVIPRVIDVVLPVGYGDDRYHSTTVDMLRRLTETYGIVKSFTGATFADKISIDLSSP